MFKTCFDKCGGFNPAAYKMYVFAEYGREPQNVRLVSVTATCAGMTATICEDGVPFLWHTAYEN